MILLSYPLVLAPPRRPVQHLANRLLSRQHEVPEEVTHLGHAQGDPRRRAALNAARLFGGAASSIFLGNGSSCRCRARTTASKAYAHIAKVRCRYHPVQLRTS